MQRVTSVKDIPNEEHFAVFHDEIVHIPGDERSKANPGHGYPEHTRNFLYYSAFFDKDELIKYLSNLHINVNPRVLKMIPVAVSREVITIVNVTGELNEPDTSSL